MILNSNTSLLKPPEDYCPQGSDQWFTIPEGYDAGKKIFYYDYVVGDAEPNSTIVFVHGNPESSYTYRHIRDSLIASGESARLIAMDHIGFGLSDQATFEMIDMHHSANLLQLIKHLDLTDVTPASFTSASISDILQVNATRDGLEFSPNVAVVNGILYNGTSTPLQSNGNQDDYYLRTDTGELFKKDDIVESSDLTTGGTAGTATSTAFFWTPNNAFDDNITNGWRTSAVALPHYLNFEFTTETAVSIFYLRAMDSATYYANAPVTFTIRGSYNGTDFDTLITVSGITWTQNEVKRFECANTNAYKHYRINITAVQNSSNVSAIGEVEFMSITTLDWDSTPIYTFTESVFDLSEIDETNFAGTSQGDILTVNAATDALEFTTPINIVVDNTDIDTGTENVDTFADTAGDGVVWDYIVKKGTNLRAGTIIACWNATGDTVEYNETSTEDIGDTSDLTLTVDIDSNNVRLRGTAASDDWSVKVVRKLI